MNRLARLFSLAALRRHVLFLASILLTAPLFALTSGNFTYSVSNGNATIKGFSTSYSGALTIPSTLGGYPVTSIGDWAFGYCSSLTSVAIPEGVTKIGSSAFSWCSSLTSVEIPEGVTSIGNYVFRDCSSLTSVEIPEGVTSIGNYVFYGCSSLTSVEIPASATSIDRYAFYGCSALTSVTIPASVTSIGNSAFYGCSALRSVTIPASVTSIGDYAFEGCDLLPTDENGIQYESQEKKVLIKAPASLAGEFTIPASVKFVHSEAFLVCSRLTSVEIPSSVTSIGNSVFRGCSSLTSVEIPASVTSIGNEAFAGCNALVITVSSGNTSYASVEGVLFNKAFTKLVSAPSVKGDYSIPSSVTSIGDWAFAYCSSLTSVTIPASVTSIGNRAFEECSSLSSVVIPSSVTSIGDSAFQYCSSLTSVTIPASVTSIGDSAFEGCSSLTSVVIPESVTSIDKETFYGCSSLTSVTIPEGVTSIGDSAFAGCSSLTSVTIPASVTSIGNYVFRDCSSLTSVKIPESVTKLGNEVFRGCSSLTSVVIPASVTSIGWYAFYGCSSLTSVTIPEGVTSISGSAFSNCNSLTSVTFLGEPCAVGGSSFPVDVTGFYPTQHAAAWKAVIVDGTWNGLKMKCVGAEAKPTVTGDEGATIEGSAEAGWTVKPSEGVGEVVVSIPEEVEPEKVTVEVPSTATSVTANGATIKVVKVDGDKRYDITDFLDFTKAGEGTIDLSKVDVQAEIAEAILDTSEAGGAVFDPSAKTPLTTAATKPGLTYTLLEGDSIDNPIVGESKVGDGQPWQPQVQKHGSSAFYRIRVSK